MAAVLTRQNPQELLAAMIGPSCHELRSPLAVVYGFAKMLENNEDLDPTTSKYVAQIVQGAQRIDDLLDSLSKTGRIASQRLVPSLESVAVRAVVEDLCATSGNCDRVHVDIGSDVHVRTDSAWLAESFQGVIDALCFDEQLDLRMSWSHDAHEVAVHFVPNATFPMVDTEPSKASLNLNLSRMRVVAMGGKLDGEAGDRVTITLPRA